MMVPPRVSFTLQSGALMTDTFGNQASYSHDHPLATDDDNMHPNRNPSLFISFTNIFGLNSHLELQFIKLYWFLLTEEKIAGNRERGRKQQVWLQKGLVWNIGSRNDI